MEVFFTDLDRTLIFSYRSDPGIQAAGLARTAEIYQGREISFMTQRTHTLLQEINRRLLVVPVTTRTREQYQRIDLGIGALSYALTCNGGVLLNNGIPDEAWYEESCRLAQDSCMELEKSIRCLEKEESRTMEVRFIEQLFVFTKCGSAESVTAKLRQKLDGKLVDVFHNGEKIYVIPAKLNKGTAAARFLKYTGNRVSYAAGDSMFDVPMLEQADAAAVPADFQQMHRLRGAHHVCKMAGKRPFSEEMLEFVLRQHKKTDRL